VLSPLFGIVRARYSTIDIDGKLGPWILALKSVPFRQYIKSEHGDLPAQSDLSFWTVGLSTFDSSITVGSRDELIEAPTMFKVMDGVQQDNRYIVTSYKNSDPFAYIILDQNFKIRIEDSVGPYSLIW